MKKILFILIFSYGCYLTAQNTDTFNERIISRYEANLPENLELYSLAEDRIKYDPEIWQVPTVNYDFLIQVKYPSILNDTLDLETAKEVLTLLNKVRPNFPEKVGEPKIYKYFFRTKDYACNKLGLKFSKVIYCEGGKIFTISLPLTADIVTVGPDYISYLAETASGKIILSSEKAPKDFPLKNDTIKILTLTSLKPDP